MTESRKEESRRANVIKAQMIAPMEAPQPAESERYGQLYNNWITPPYNIWHLTLLPEVSSELGPCIDAIIEGSFGHGYKLMARSEVEEGATLKKKEEKTVAGERVRAKNFLRRINRTQDIVAFSKEIVRNRIGTGNGYCEVTRNAKGEISSLHNVPAHQIRIAPQEVQPVLVTPKLIERNGTEDGWVISTSRSFYDRYRKYVRSPDVGNGWADLHVMAAYADKGLGISGRISDSFYGTDLVWYKEYGDERPYGDKTGAPNPKETEGKAHELYHFVSDTKRGPYGLPAFIGNRLAILGDRKQEEINYNTLLNNSVPSMMILCSDGEITADSAERLRDHWEKNVRGSDNRSKVVIVEAKPFVTDVGDDTIGKPKIEVVKLYDAQVREGIYEKYSERNRRAIRHGLRIPDICLGEGSATDTSRQVIREKLTFFDLHVCGPYRQLIEDFINERIFPELGLAHVCLKFNSPNTSDPEILANVARDLEKSGGMTPRRSTMIAEMILGVRLPEMDKKVNLDVPFTIQVMESQQKVDEANAAAGSDPKAKTNNEMTTDPSQNTMGEG